MILSDLRRSAVRAAAANVLLAGLCFLVIALALRDVTTAPLSRDEAFSLRLATMPWRLAWSGAVADAVHPPVFTMMLKLWIALGGQSLLWLRLLPAIASCLLLAPFLLLMEEFNISREAAVLALAALLANETRLYYTHIFRSYPILALLSALSIWLFARNSRTIQVTLPWSVAYCAVNLWMCWMHYFGLWVVGVQFLLALAVYRKELGRAVLSGAMVCASFLLWAPSLRIASSRQSLDYYVGWMSRPTLGDLVWFYHALIGVPSRAMAHLVPVGFALFALPLLVWCVMAFRRPREMPAGGDRLLVHLLPYVTVPVLATFLLCQVGSVSLFADRVLIFVVLPYCLLIAAAVTRIPVRPLRVGLSCALFVWTGCAAFAAAAKTPRSDTQWDVLTACLADPSGSPLPVRGVDPFMTWYYGEYLRASGRPADYVAAVQSFRTAMPERFWAEYYIFPAWPGYSAGLASDLRAGGYATVRRCSVPDSGGGSPLTVFDLESRDTATRAGF